ncbi:MAG: MFS transporter [Spirochaetes bacterium]|nr:MFS transporter [Spirochaetota bacterium]
MLKKLYLVFIIILLFFIFFNKGFLNIRPFTKFVSFNMPYRIVGDRSNNIYVIDNSKRRIIKFDQEGYIKYIINGGLRDNGKFFYAEDFVFDDNENLYVVNRIPDKGGFYTISEEIVRYSKDGKYLDKIFKIEYKEKDSNLIQKGKINKIIYSNKQIKWFYLDKDEIVYYIYDISLKKIIEVKKFLFQYASILIYNIIEFNNFQWLLITKKGDIILLDYSKGSFFTNFVDRNIINSPYDIAIDTFNNLYFSDILDRSIYRYKYGVLEKFISEQDLNDEGIFYNIFILNSSKDVLFTGFNDKILMVNIETKNIHLYDKCYYKNSQFLFINIFWIVFIFTIVNIIAFIFSFLITIIRKNSKVFFNVILIVIVATLSTFFITKLMLKNFNNRYIDIVDQKCSLMVQMISSNLNGDILERIKTKDDFLSKDYMELREFLHKALNYNNDRWNENYYFAIYKVIDNKLYGYMYLNDQIGINYPILGWYEEEDSAPSKAIKGEIVFEIDEDQWGSWFYSMGPIKNSKGEIIGLIEIGSDFYSFNLENWNLIKRVILDIATILVVLIIIFFEFLFITDIVDKKDKKNSEFSDTYFVRPFNFIFTFAISMSISFIPLMMRDIYIKFIDKGNNFVFNWGQELIIALPLSSEMLLFSIALLLGGIVVNFSGFRKVMIFGIIISTLGLLFSALFDNPYLFIFARAIVGLGSGFILISLRSCINCEMDQVKRSLSFSHYYSGALAGVNAGVVIGAFFADQYGYKLTFYVAVILIIISFIFGLKYLIKNEDIKTNRNISNVNMYSKIFQLLFNWKVISYLIFAIMPTYVAGMFLFYYLPLFSEKINLNISDVGRLFILNGILIIYLGPFLSGFMKKYISNRTGIFLTSIFWALTIIYFALNQNLIGLILTIIFMGIVEGFGVVFQNDFFLEIPVVKKIGEDLSVTYFELFAKFAEVIAPIIFGWILLFKEKNGMFLFGIIMIVISIIYFFPFLFSFIKRKKQRVV